MPAISPPTSSCRTAVSRCLGFALSALAAAALAAPVAGAADAKHEGISADGRVAIFSTTDRLVPGDTDIRRDIYERSIDAVVGDYVTRQVSVGPAGGNNAFDALYYGVSQDGSKTFFSTIERLTPDDTDSVLDVYMRDLVARTTTRVSRGDASCEPSCGNGSDPVSQVGDSGISVDGDVVFFATRERLNPAVDTDSSLDVYVRDLSAGSTELVSRGDSTCEISGCGRAAIPTFFLGASAAGDKAFISTEEDMVGAGSDGDADIYERDLTAGATSLVSIAGDCPGSLLPGQNCDPSFGGVSSDGSHAFFETRDRVTGGDTDDFQDVYSWSADTATLVSVGPDGGIGRFDARYAGSSPDGSTAFFVTGERLDATADTDAAEDVYARTGSTTELVSAGDPSCAGSNCGNGNLPAALRWVSPETSSALAVISTYESLASDDGDASQDIYLRDLIADTTTLVSAADSSCVVPACGDGAFDAQFVGASRDASHVFFTTDESLVPADMDPSGTDVYDRSASATSLVSTGPATVDGDYDSQLFGASQDGLRAFFVTRERLTGDDDYEQEDDVYMRSPAGTLLVSVGNGEGLVLVPPEPRLGGTNPASPNASTMPLIFGDAPDGSSIKIYVSDDCSGEPIATEKTAAQLASPGIAVTVDIGSTTTFRATAEADGFISGCSDPIIYKQQNATSPPPPPPPPPDSGGGDTGGTGGGGSTAPAGAGGILGPGGIVYVTPSTRITFAPGFKTRKRRPVFRFTDSTGQEGTSFICKINRQRWRRCGSPKRLKKLKRGKKHVFKVKAVNAVGIWEPKPVKRKFKLVGRR